MRSVRKLKDFSVDLERYLILFMSCIRIIRNNNKYNNEKCQKTEALGKHSELNAGGNKQTQLYVYGGTGWQVRTCATNKIEKRRVRASPVGQVQQPSS